MDIRLRRPDLSLEQERHKPSASHWAGVQFVYPKDVSANLQESLLPRLPVRRLYSLLGDQYAPAARRAHHFGVKGCCETRP